MGSHPLNLVLRFLLELAALAAIGLWGWRSGLGGWRYVLVIALPLVAATGWGVFNVPGDPSRSGAAPVVVQGVVRLAVEFLVFGAGIWALKSAGYPGWSRGFLVVLLIHYGLSWDRILWLFRH